jgi:hypothetical protein
MASNASLQVRIHHNRTTRKQQANDVSRSESFLSCLLDGARLSRVASFTYLQDQIRTRTITNSFCAASAVWPIKYRGPVSRDRVRAVLHRRKMNPTFTSWSICPPIPPSLVHNCNQRRRHNSAPYHHHLHHPQQQPIAPTCRTLRVGIGIQSPNTIIRILLWPLLIPCPTCTCQEIHCLIGRPVAPAHCRSGGTTRGQTRPAWPTRSTRHCRAVV